MGQVRRRRTGLEVVAIVAVALPLAGPAGATDSNRAAPRPAADGSTEGSTDVVVDTSPRGARIQLDHEGTWRESGSADGRGSGGGSTARSCARRWVPSPGPLYARPDAPRSSGAAVWLSGLSAAPSAEHRAYHVFCDDAYLTTGWFAPGEFSAAAPSASEIAERLVRELPFPAAAIGVSPAGRGLTGLASWFWVEGYDGTALTDSLAGFGLTVEVDAAPDQVVWDFGDGTETSLGVEGLGVAAPRRSPVTHVYEQASTAGVSDAAYVVRVVIRIATRYRIDGGPWIPLDAVERAAVANYPVAESRARLVPSSPS